MFNPLRSALLRFLRVPPEPEPPFGDPASLKIFRASPKFYKFRLLGWGIGQLFALAGLIFGIVVMLMVENKAEEIRSRPAAEVVIAPAVQTEKNPKETKSKPAKTAKGKRGFKGLYDDLARVVAKVPPRWFILIWILKLLGALFYLAQLALTYAALRLDYELRWYVVTDRSLRIRTGLLQVQELTMSFANLQQVALSQGPVQRLLGIADVRVQSAGGGEAHHAGGQSTSLHTGFFHGVDNAAEVRDLILARLRHFRETGLGDKDEVRPTAPTSTAAANPAVASAKSAALSAACELLAETRQLRATLMAAGK